MNGSENRQEPSEPPEQFLPLKTLLWRGWRKKCPRCGEGPLYRRWQKLHDQCPKCGLKYLEDQGDLLGPMIFIDRIVFLVPLVTVFCFVVPDSPPSVYVPVVALMMGLLIFTMENRNGACVALDYYFRQNRNFWGS